MGDLPESFPVSVRVRTKQSKKTCVGLWGQSAVLKAVWSVTLPALTLFFIKKRKLGNTYFGFIL